MACTTHYIPNILAPNQSNSVLGMFIFLLLCAYVVNLCALRTHVRYRLMCIFGFVVINLVLVMVTVTIAVFVVDLLFYRVVCIHVLSLVWSSLEKHMQTILVFKKSFWGSMPPDPPPSISYSLMGTTSVQVRPNFRYLFYYKSTMVTLQLFVNLTFIVCGQ